MSEDRIAELEKRVAWLEKYIHITQEMERNYYEKPTASGCYKHSPDPDCPGCKPSPETITINRKVAERWFDKTNEYGIMHEGVEALYLEVRRALSELNEKGEAK